MPIIKNQHQLCMGKEASKRRVGDRLTSSSNIVKAMSAEGDEKEKKCHMVGGSCVHYLLVLDQFYYTFKY